MSVILATGGYDHKIRFWEAPSGLCSRTLPFRGSQINHLEVTPDKQFLAAGGNPFIRLYDVEHNNGGSGDGGGGGSGGDNNNGDNNNATTSSSSQQDQQQQQQQSVNPVLTCEGHRSNVTSLGFQPNGRWMYSGSEDGTVKIWDLRSNTFSRSFDARAAVNSVCLHPNQVEIISGDSNGNVKIWDLGSSRCINDVCPNRNSLDALSPIQSVTISDDCRILAAVSNSSEVYVWDPSSSSSSSTRDLRPIAKFRSHPLGHYALRAKISPDGRHLVTTSSDRTARLWDTERWEGGGNGSGGVGGTSLKQHRGWVWDAVFSADSSYLVTACSDHCARLWNLRSGEVVRQYNGHVGAVTCVALNDSST